MVEYSGSKTEKAVENLDKTINEKSWTSSWGVDTSNAETTNYKEAIANGINTLGDTALNLTADSAEIVGDLIGSLADPGYAEVADAASAAALNYINQKIERIRTAWTTQESVTVKALLEEVSPYAMDFKSAFAKLGTKVSSLVGYLVDVKGDDWTELAKNLGRDALNDITSDPGVVESVANLKGVQAYAKTLTTITTTINNLSRVIKVIEPLLPILEIAYELAASWCTGGSSTVKAGQDSVEEGMTIGQKALSLSLQAVRKYVYNIKIKVPSLLVGALNSISVKEAVIGYGIDNDWLNAIFSEKFYEDAVNSLTWKTSITSALNTVNTQVNTINNKIVSTPYAGILLQRSSSLYLSQNPRTQLSMEEASDLGRRMKEAFLKSLTKTFMELAVTHARQVAGLKNLSEIEWEKVDTEASNLVGNTIIKQYDSELDKLLDYANLAKSPISTVDTEKSVLATSKQILDGIQSSETQKSYTNFSMHKMIVDAFQNDGCDCNSLRKEYDEQRTYEGGFSSRLSFKEFNDKIIEYHDLLKVLRGEQRANIRESIPVIDFYNPENTSLLNAYEINEADQVDPTIIIPIPADGVLSEARRTPALKYIEEEDPYIINRAVMGENLAEHFWNTSAPTSKNPNLQVAPWRNIEGSTAWIYKGIISTPVMVEGQTYISYRTNDCFVANGISLYIDFNPVGSLPETEGEGPVKNVTLASEEGTLCYINSAGGIDGQTGTYYLNIEYSDVCIILPKIATSSDPTKILIFRNTNMEDESESEDSKGSGVSLNFNAYYLEVETYSLSETLEPIAYGEELPSVVQNAKIQEVLPSYMSFEKEYYTEASGLLCGLYCEPKEKEHLFSGDMVNKWKLVGDHDIAKKKNVIIDVGTKYFTGHILGRGLIKEAPLKLTEGDLRLIKSYTGISYPSLQDAIKKSPYKGKASLTYKAIENSTQNLLNSLINKNCTQDVWSKVGIPPLDCVTTKADYNGYLIKEPDRQSILGSSNLSNDVLVYADKLRTGTSADTSTSLTDLLLYFEGCSDCLTLNGDNKHYTLTLNMNDEYVCYKKTTRVNGTWLNFGWITNDEETFPSEGPFNTLASDLRKVFYVSYYDRWKYKRKKHIGNFKGVSIKTASPIKVFDKRSPSEKNFNHKTILVYPEYNKYFPNTLFLISKDDLCLEAYDPKNSNGTNCLCSFYNTTEGKVVCFKVDRVSKFLLSKVDTIVLKDSSSELTIKNTDSEYRKVFFDNTDDCYVYQLSAIELNIQAEIYDQDDNLLDLSGAISATKIVPMTYTEERGNYFPVKVKTSSLGELTYIVDTANRAKDLETLKNSFIIPGLPYVEEYSEYNNISQNGISLSIFSNFFTSGLGTVKQILSQKALLSILSEWPFSTSEINPIRFSDIYDVLSGLTTLKESLTDLVKAEFRVPVDHILTEDVYINGASSLTTVGVGKKSNSSRTYYKSGKTYYESYGTSSDGHSKVREVTIDDSDFEFSTFSESVVVSEKDIESFTRLIDERRPDTLNLFSINFKDDKALKISELEEPQTLASVLEQAIDDRINLITQQKSDLRPSLTDLKNLYLSTLKSEDGIDKEKCEELDKAFGSKASAFLRFGGSLAAIKITEDTSISDNVESISQQIIDKISTYVLEIDEELKNYYYDAYLTNASQYETYKKNTVRRKAKYLLYDTYHPDHPERWSMENLYVMFGTAYYPAGNNVYPDASRTYYHPTAGEGTDEDPYTYDEYIFDPEPEPSKYTLNQILANRIGTSKEEEYVKNHPFEYGGLGALITWPFRRISALRSNEKFAAGVLAVSESNIRAEWDKIKKGVYDNNLYAEIFEESEPLAPEYLTKDTVEEYFGTAGRITINFSGLNCELEICLPKHDVNPPTELSERDVKRFLHCTLLEESDTFYCFTFKNAKAEPDISVDLLEGLANFIKTCLEGTGSHSYYVKYTDGDEEPSGRENSLYYRRYIMLNNRMNKLKGPLSTAARFLSSKTETKKALAYDSSVIESFKDFIEVIPINSMEELTYLPPQEATGTTIELEGKFYSKKELEALRSEIHSKCALTCRYCSVKDSCPFYSEEEVIKLYVTPVGTIDLWIKDNKLDLLAYEYENADGTGALRYPKLTCIESPSNEAGEKSSMTLGEEIFKNIHKPFADISGKKASTEDKDPETSEIRNLEHLRRDLAKANIDFSEKTDQNRDNLGWLMNGRYGTVQLNPIKNLENEEYPQIQEQLPRYTYLYDAMFIKDEETYIEYSPSTQAYPVTVTTGPYENKRVYTGEAKIMIPRGLNIFRNANPRDDIYLVSDDVTDADGKEIVPVIYICPVSDFRFTFDLQETPPGKGIETEDDASVYAQDVAQWCVNYIKGTCMEDPLNSHPDTNLDKDQYWMENIQKSVANEDGTYRYITVPGRAREASIYSEAVVDESTFDEVLAIAGKPSVVMYQNFIRKFSIDMRDEGGCVRWVKEGSSLDKEVQRSILPLMKTNLRLVIVHNYSSEDE